MSLSVANLQRALVTTSTVWQPGGWGYAPPPTPYHAENRHWVPPQALPWYYTCEPMYLLGWLAMRVVPPFVLLGLAFGWSVG